MSATAELSPPYEELPHVATDPSDFLAAKAPRLATTSTTPLARMAEAEALLPP